jgi:hypothetical protein
MRLNRFTISGGILIQRFHYFSVEKLRPPSRVASSLLLTRFALESSYLPGRDTARKQAEVF